MSDVIQLFRANEMSSEMRREWIDLFSRCFKKSSAEGLRVLTKYDLNAGMFCLLRSNGSLVASYSGLIIDFEGRRIFLSTDTMSDGSVRGGSVRLANHLYEKLQSEGVSVVCGYPNDNIREIRRIKLGWRMHGGIDMYIGIPCLWRLFRSRPNKKVWQIQRPSHGFFIRSGRGFRLLGRDRLYGDGLGVVFTLSSFSPGPFFIRVPRRLFSRRTFGYRFLSDDAEFERVFLDSLHALDIETIDVP